MENKIYNTRKLRQKYYLAEKKLIRKTARLEPMPVKEYESDENQAGTPWLVWRYQNERNFAVRILAESIRRHPAIKAALAEIP